MRHFGAAALRLVLAIVVVVGASSVIWISSQSLAAAGAMAQRVPTTRVCRVHVKTPILALGGARHFAEVRYEVTRDCAVKLMSLRYAAAPPRFVPQDAAQMTLSLVPAAALPATASGTFHCGALGWEEEVVNLKMIQIQNVTTVTADSGAITNVHIDATPDTFYYWWQKTDGPYARSWWVTKPTVAHTIAQASFVCDGGPFGCNPGRNYAITLKAITDVFADGRCRTGADYEGTIVPQGKFVYQAIQ